MTRPDVPRSFSQNLKLCFWKTYQNKQTDLTRQQESNAHTSQIASMTMSTHQRMFAAALDDIKSTHGMFLETPEHTGNPVFHGAEGPAVPYYHLLFEDPDKYDTNPDGSELPPFAGWGLRSRIWTLVPEYHVCEESVYDFLEVCAQDQ
jgi:hypothetical protein